MPRLLYIGQRPGRIANTTPHLALIAVSSVHICSITLILIRHHRLCTTLSLILRITLNHRLGVPFTLAMQSEAPSFLSIPMPKRLKASHLNKVNVADGSVSGLFSM